MIDKVKEALDILYQTCLISKCDDNCPLSKFCEYIWGGHFDCIWDTIENMEDLDD